MAVPKAPPPSTQALVKVIGATTEVGSATAMAAARASHDLQQVCLERCLLAVYEQQWQQGL